MGKRKPYRIHRVNRFDWASVLEFVEAQRVTVGIDVGKEKRVAAVVDEGEAVVKTVGWSHPVQTPEFISFLHALKGSSAGVEVALEPSGVYGDALRHQLLQAGFDVFRVSPMKSYKADEIYDGVPSSHDAKSAGIVAWLHQHGRSDAWPVAPESERSFKAALQMLEVHTKQLRSNLGRLEAVTARHWPELTSVLQLGSATMLELLLTFGSASEVAAHPEEARTLMKRVAPSLDPAKVEAVLQTAKATLGVPPVAHEVVLLRGLASEARRNQREQRQARKRVEALAEANEESRRMAEVVGKTTAAVVVAAAGDPSGYESPQALVKSLGLNLKERSSGKKEHRGVHITKRGSSSARFYLFMAALRLIHTDRIVGAWYAKKVARDGGRCKLRGVVAVQRKLVLALWHVARGAPFDASRLFDVRCLVLSTA